MRFMRYSNVLILAAVLMGFGATAHAADQGSTQNLRQITGHVLFMTPDEMQVGTSNGIVDLKITKQTEINPNVTQNDYVDVWYENVPNVGNVVVRYAKSSQPEPQQSGKMQSGQNATSSSSGTSNAMQGSQPSSSSQPAASQPMQESSSSQPSSQPSQSSSQGMKQLPHTASSWPLVGLVGVLALVGAVALTVPRLRG